MEKRPMSAGENKIQEYITRIENGESKDKIVEGLPPSFVAGIEAGITKKNSNQQNISHADEVKIAEIKNELGIIQKENKIENAGKYPLVAGLVESSCEGKKQAVVDLYKNLLDHIDESESRKKLVAALFQSVYNKYRIAEYPNDPNEEQTWDNALKSTKVEINNRKSEWMYRGIFPKNGEETVTRGSLNVNVTPELIESLDELIISGKIRANYKFGQYGTTTSPTERHDSVSIYFLEQPSDEALQELVQTVKFYVRGDNLLGKKIGDGFFMSEVGSVETKHIELLIEELKLKDSAFAEAVKGYTSPRPGGGSSLKMSEAQFYAIKDVACAFGYNISYNKDLGFEIK